LIRLLRLRILVKLALRRDHGPPLPFIPAHGRFDGREALDVRRKRRLTMITKGIKTAERDMAVRRAAGAASSKMAMSVSSLICAEQNYLGGVTGFCS
jgi:hypothetical protein